MDPKQLHDYVIVPTLNHLDKIALKDGRVIPLNTLAASRLLLGIALVESDLKLVRQLKGGPAQGLWQMEPATHDDIWANWLQYRQDLATRVRELGSQGWPRGATQAEGNLYYACAMARCLLARRPEHLPPEDNPVEMAQYHKLYYNTMLGATNPTQSVISFDLAIQLTPKGDTNVRN